MRRFLILAHRVPTNGQFTLNDLAGGAGRMDEIARAVSTAFTLSNDLRRDTELTVLFVADPPPKARRVVLSGAKLRFLNPDERSTAALLKNALVRAVDFPRPFESSPGLTVAPADPAEEVRSFLHQENPVWLSEDGLRIEEWPSPGGQIAAVVSDPYDPTPEEQELLRSTGAPLVSVGPRSLRTSQVIDLVHHELDLREAAHPPGGAGTR
jgi:tRNA (pseudouridine54-N1)-methyltransferase